MLDGRGALKACLHLLCTDRHQLIHTAPYTAVTQAQSPSGLVSDGGNARGPGAAPRCDFSLSLNAHLWLMSWQITCHSARTTVPGMLKVLWKRHGKELFAVCESKGSRQPTWVSFAQEFLVTTQVDNDFTESLSCLRMMVRGSHITESNTVGHKLEIWQTRLNSITPAFCYIIVIR